MSDAVAIAAAVSSATALAMVTRAIVRPPRPLAGRLRPYTTAARAQLGLAPEPVAEPGVLLSGGVLRRVLTAPLARLERRGAGASDLGLRLAQAGLFPDVEEAGRVAEYRFRQVVSGFLGMLGLGAVALVAGLGGPGALLLGALGAVSGASRWRGHVDRAITERRRRLRLELATVNQLLAVHVRVGGGVVQAVQRVTARSSGAVAAELRQALVLHRGGLPLDAALARVAETTPEPQAARTYRLLSGAVTLGSDLAAALRALSTDLRAEQVEELTRSATRRRAAVLVPIILVLAPVMLLFIAAPIPSLVFAGL